MLTGNKNVFWGCFMIRNERKSKVPSVPELSGEKQQQHLSQSKSLSQQSCKNKTHLKKKTNYNFCQNTLM